MQRNNLKALLQQYQPASTEEQFQKQLMLEFLDTCSDCFERSCPVGHFTASSWIVNSTGTQCLLLHHAKFDQWLQLGGHCDGDSDVLNVAIKEAQEESGILNFVPLSENIFDIDMHLIPQYKDVPPHYHYDVRFLLQAEPNAVINRNNESKDVRWFDLDPAKLPTAQPSVLRMLNKYL